MKGNILRLISAMIVASFLVLYSVAVDGNLSPAFACPDQENAVAGINKDEVLLSDKCPADVIDTGGGDSGDTGDGGGGGNDEQEVAVDDGKRHTWAHICDLSGTGNFDLACMNEDFGCPEDSDRQRRWNYTVADPNLVATSELRCSPVVEDSPEGEAAEQVVVTLEEFRRLPLPASEIIFENGVEGEPMYGIALIGHHVNLWADSEEFETTTSILGAPVDVKATPIEYRWTYGDGQYRTTPHAGEPRPDGVDPYEYKTHTSIVYEEAGNYDVALETVYAGYFRTGGSGWIPIPGVAVVASDPKVNSIWKTETRLVSEDCTENPDGWACESPFLKTPPWEQG